MQRDHPDDLCVYVRTGGEEHLPVLQRIRGPIMAHLMHCVTNDPPATVPPLRCCHAKFVQLDPIDLFNLDQGNAFRCGNPA
jgi:hypothetical protein